jgi:uroporphyrinogen-III synthase
VTIRRALVTRPPEDAEGIALALAARGIAVQLEPLLTIRVLDGPPLSLAGLQGVLATSANGVRALAARCCQRDLPLWAVGDATARCARDMGFASVAAAAGNVERLAELVIERVDPRAGPLLHVAGTRLAGDLAGRLTEAGFTVRRAVLYEARAAETASPALLAALDQEALDLALFFSPRTAETFVTLLQGAARETSCRRMQAIALSPAVAERLSRLPWKRIHVAAQPDQAALLSVLDAEARL